MYRPTFGSPRGSGLPAVDSGRLVPRPRTVRVAGFLRSSTPGGTDLDLAEQRIAHFVESRGWQLAGVFRDHGIVTLGDAGPALERILDMLGHGEIKGMVTLASYTISWDFEVVRHIEQRFAQLGGFVTYLYGTAGPGTGVPRQGG